MRPTVMGRPGYLLGGLGSPRLRRHQRGSTHGTSPARRRAEPPPRCSRPRASRRRLPPMLAAHRTHRPSQACCANRAGRDFKRQRLPNKQAVGKWQETAAFARPPGFRKPSLKGQLAVENADRTAHDKSMRQALGFRWHRRGPDMPESSQQGVCLRDAAQVWLPEMLKALQHLLVCQDVQKRRQRASVRPTRATKGMPCTGRGVLRVARVSGAVATVEGASSGSSSSHSKSASPQISKNPSAISLSASSWEDHILPF